MIAPILYYFQPRRKGVAGAIFGWSQPHTGRAGENRVEAGEETCLRTIPVHHT